MQRLLVQSWSGIYGVVITTGDPSEYVKVTVAETRAGLPLGGGGPMAAGPVGPIMGIAGVYGLAKTEVIDAAKSRVSKTVIT